MERLSEKDAMHLARAKAHLELAIGRYHDPVTAVALAGALEEVSRRAGREHKPPQTIVELVDGAVAEVTAPRIEATPGRRVSWMLGQRTWLWPRDPTLRSRLNAAVGRSEAD